MGPTEKFEEKIEVEKLPPKRDWLSAALLALAGSWGFGINLSPWASRSLLAEKILLNPEFAASFENGKFKHLHERSAEFIKGSIWGIPKNLDTWQLKNNVSKELKQGGVTWGKAWSTQSIYGKALDIFLAVPIFGICAYWIYKTLKKPQQKSEQSESSAVIAAPIPAKQSETLSQEPAKTRDDHTAGILKAGEAHQKEERNAEPGFVKQVLQSVAAESEAIHKRTDHAARLIRDREEQERQQQSISALQTIDSRSF